ADLFVVVAFRMLPEAVWNMPPKGTINLHASLLPQYRGAAPINWAIINGEKSTGVTTFFLDHEIDTGKVIEQRSVSIGENETIGELYERLMHLGTETVLSTLDKIQSGDYQAIDQGSFDISALKHAPKIFREDCEIDLQLTAAEVHNKIRGLSPYPAAWIKLRSLKDDSYKTFKIFRSLKTDTPVIEGHHLERSSNGILFPCSDYYVEVLELQPEGKRKMSAKEFLAGNDISDWSL
ncbi:MAG: methionyl-tRNA formyltransferase, partial [Bacteroidetes bacterium]